MFRVVSFWAINPPPTGALLLVTRELVTFTVASKPKIPPPVPASLCVIVEAWTFNVTVPPPAAAAVTSAAVPAPYGGQFTVPDAIAEPAPNASATVLSAPAMIRTGTARFHARTVPALIEPLPRLVSAALMRLQAS